MKHLIALLIVGVVAAGALVGAAGAASKKEAPKSLDPTSYFHQLHVQKMTMQCANCHSSETSDILFLRKDDVVPAAMPGQVDRHICLTCHQAPGQPTWYGSPAR